MIILKDKLEAPGFTTPYYEVAGEKIYSKAKAVKKCKAVGWEWPSFSVWPDMTGFHRPKTTFDQAVDRQCEIISDTYSKVRVFYSGGRDSGLVLESMLRNRARIDEIAVYRRFPGVIDSNTNEFDRFNVLANLNARLASYNRSIPIKFYDIMPEHFNQYSKNMEEQYFDYMGLFMFTHNVHTVAECYPQIIKDEWVNVMGHAFPEVDDQGMHWIDNNFNLSTPDPNVIFFFCDKRNTDLAVHLAYAARDHQKGKSKMDFASGNERSFSYLKNKFNFPKTVTELDQDWNLPKFSTNTHRWILEKKVLLLIANALQTSMGRDTYDNMVRYYEKFEAEYGKFFTNNCIYNYWIGSKSENHALLDG